MRRSVAGPVLTRSQVTVYTKVIIKNPTCNLWPPYDVNEWEVAVTKCKIDNEKAFDIHQGICSKLTSVRKSGA